MKYPTDLTDRFVWVPCEKNDPDESKEVWCGCNENCSVWYNYKLFSGDGKSSIWRKKVPVPEGYERELNAANQKLNDEQFARTEITRKYHELAVKQNQELADMSLKWAKETTDYEYTIGELKKELAEANKANERKAEYILSRDFEMMLARL